MFISTVNTKINVNDIVINYKDLDVGDYGIFTKGHEFKVLSLCKNEYGYSAYNVIDNDGIELTIQFNLVYKKLDFNTAKRIRKEQLDFNKNLELMKKQCKFAYDGVEDREIVSKCQKKTHWSICEPEITCDKKFWKKIKLNNILKD